MPPYESLTPKRDTDIAGTKVMAFLSKYLKPPLQSEVFIKSTIAIFPLVSLPKNFPVSKLQGKVFCYLCFIFNEHINFYQHRFVKLNKSSNRVQGF